MIAIHPHVNFNGNAEEAFTFYKSVFGGEFARVARFKDFSNPEFPMPASEAEKIMHIALPIGATMLMGNDVPSFMGKTNEHENRSKIAITLDDRTEAERIFAALSAGGEVEVPLDESAWNSYFCMFRDRYGIEWMIDCA